MEVRPSSRAVKLTPDNLRRLLEVSEEAWSPLWRFLAYTGARQGEALALLGSNVERKEGYSVVRIEPHTLPGGEPWTPKTASGTRALAVPSYLVPEALPASFLFVPRLRRPVYRVTVQRALTAACKAAGIPRITTHDFRRMRITQALLAGAEPVSLSRAVGHRSLSTTVGYLREIPMLCELPDLDAPPVANPAAAAWTQTLVRGKKRS